jgi:hypothetical protein
MSEAIGESGALHTTRTNIKIVESHTGASHSGHFRLSTRPEVQVFTASRSLATIVGPVTCTIKGPASPQKATVGSATITPHDLINWPADVAEVRLAAESQDSEYSLYLKEPTHVLVFHPAINHQLKPPPVIGRHPSIAYAFHVTGGAATDTTTIEISFTLELSGIDYVPPAGW